MSDTHNCIFCKIVRGEIPSHKVYEGADFLAFLDINPQSPGHLQVIPKQHYRWVWDVPNVGEYFEVVKKIAQAQMKAFETDWIISKIVGDEVQHAHIWALPGIKRGNSSSQELLKKFDKKDFEGNVERIKKELK